VFRFANFQYDAAAPAGTFLSLLLGLAWQKLDQAARAGATFNIFQQLGKKYLQRN
jgi:hypothetical protein